MSITGATVAPAPAQATTYTCPAGANLSGTVCTQVFDTNGSWVVPATVTQIDVLLIGGGGGGGAGYQGNGDKYSGGGGGGGHVAQVTKSVSQDDTLNINVGAGGTGGVVNGAAATAGGASWIDINGDDTTTAPGGGAGVSGSATGPGDGGSSGLVDDTPSFAGGTALIAAPNGAGGGGAGAGQIGQGSAARVAGYIQRDGIIPGASLNAQDWNTGSYTGVGPGMGGNGYAPVGAFEGFSQWSGGFTEFGAGGGAGTVLGTTAFGFAGSATSSQQLGAGTPGDGGNGLSSTAASIMNAYDRTGGGGGGGGAQTFAQAGGNGGTGLVVIRFPAAAVGLTDLVVYEAFDAGTTTPDDTVAITPAFSASTTSYEAQVDDTVTTLWLRAVGAGSSTVTVTGGTVTALTAPYFRVDNVVVGTTTVTATASLGGTTKAYSIAVMPIVAPPDPGKRALAWGYNDDGQLGDGTSRDRSSPVQVAFGANASGQWDSLAGGYYQSCGIDLGGEAYCWGDNSRGQLGDGTTAAAAEPVAVLDGDNSAGKWKALSLGGGDKWSCGLSSDAKAYCWGANGSDAYLGNGTTGPAVSEPDAVVNGANTAGTYTAIAAGYYHTCALGTDNETYCWGYDSNDGVLGNGQAQAISSSPVRVVDGANSSGTWKSVTSGYYGSCGIGGDDKAYCWGAGSYGEMGNGTTTGVNLSPVAVSDGQNTTGKWRALARGYYGVCGIGFDDNVYCWGYYAAGASSGTLTVPTRVTIPGNPAVTAIAYAQENYTACAIAGADVWCWGANDYGELGNGTLVDADQPVAASLTGSLAGAAPKRISMGGSSTFLVAQFGSDPAPTPTPTPDPVFPPSTPRDVSALPGDRSAVVSWREPLSSGSFPVTTYKATSSPAGQTCLVAAPTLTCTITGLANGTAYTVKVEALNGAGWSTGSAPSAPVTPGGATPAPPVQPLPAPLDPGGSLLQVNGVVDPNVKVDSNASANGLTITGDNWSMGLDGLGPDGNPLDLGPSGSLRLQDERDVATEGTGFLPNSQVDLYVNPPVETGAVGVRASTEAIYVGTVRTDASGDFVGTATLPEDIAPGEHVLQATGYSPGRQARAMSLGVVVEPSLVLDKGTRKADGRHDRIRTTGSSTGIEAGTRLTPWIRYSGQTSFTQGKATITVQSDGTFRWTRQIRKDKGITAYVSYVDTRSNEVFWAKVR